MIFFFRELRGAGSGMMYKKLFKIFFAVRLSAAEKVKKRKIARQEVGAYDYV